MTNIEQKALALVNEVARERGYIVAESSRKLSVYLETVCRAIERHEQFAQDVSDAVEAAKRVYGGHREAFDQLDRFIIAKPDPLGEAMQEWWDADGYASIDTFRAAIKKRGGKIVWGEG